MGPNIFNWNRPPIAHYIQSLVLRPHALGYYMYGASDFRGFLAETLWRLKGRMDTRANPTGPAAVRILLRDVAKMQNITSLKVIHTCTDTYPYFVLALPLVTGALLSSGSRIQNLSLDVPLESYEHILPPALQLNTLENLNVVLHGQHNSPNKFSSIDYLSATLVPFILRHRHTLRHMSIDIPYRHGSADLSSIFPGLCDRFLQLISLTISIPLEYLYKPGIQTLLANHSDVIQELKLIFYPPFLRQHLLLSPDELFSMPIFQIPLPQLRVLDIDLWMWPEADRQSVRRNLVNYLYPIQDILSVLILRHHLFCVDDLRSILDLSKGSLSSLSRLQICVRYLCVDLLDLLSSRLPRLLCLDISFDTLGGYISDSNNAQNSYPVSTSLSSLSNTSDIFGGIYSDKCTGFSYKHAKALLRGLVFAPHRVVVNGKCCWKMGRMPRRNCQRIAECAFVQWNLERSVVYGEVKRVLYFLDRMATRTPDTHRTGLYTTVILRTCSYFPCQPKNKIRFNNSSWSSYSRCIST